MFEGMICASTYESNCEERSPMMSPSCLRRRKKYVRMRGVLFGGAKGKKQTPRTARLYHKTERKRDGRGRGQIGGGEKEWER